ncbi:MAG: universal stress protein [Vicinamibacterales bacterium]
MLNISRVLCPIDFSEASRHAFEQAVIVSRFFEARLAVLHVYNQVFLPVPGLAMPAYGGEVPLSDSELAQLRQSAEAFAAPARSAGLTVDVTVEPGQPVAHILRRAREDRADLLVLGTHGTSGFEHLVLGSVTEKVLRKASCPVLTVPPRAASAAAVPFRHILCAVDFSECSLAALDAALSFAQEADAELTLLHVLDWPIHEAPVPAVAAPEAGVPGPVFDLTGYRQMLEKDAANRLTTLVPAGARDWCTPRTRVVHGTPHVAILQAAADDGADLVVLGVRGRTALDLMLFGSTTNQVVRRATCPVLTIRG